MDAGALWREPGPREVPGGETTDGLPRCRGTLIFASGSLPVEILDVSIGGTELGFEKPAPPVGSRALLILGCLPERPSVPCVLRNATDRNAGVPLLAGPRIAERIALETVRCFAATPGATPPAPQGPAALPGIRD